MKKIVTLCIFIPAFISCSYSLEDLNRAIIDTDKNMVLQLLNSLEINYSELTRLCSLADQTIEKRKNLVGFYFKGRLKPGNSYKYNSNETCFLISSTIFSLLVGLYNVGKTYFSNPHVPHSIWDSESHIEQLKKTAKQNNYILSIFLSAFIGIIGFSFIEDQRHHRYGSLLQGRYNDALEIKSHIWQHFNQQKETFQKNLRVSYGS